MRGLIVALLLLAMTPAASAGVITTNCGAGQPNMGEGSTISGYERLCIIITNPTTYSGVFHVRAESAYLCWDPHILSDGVATASAVVRRCIDGTATGPTETRAYNCAVVDALLDGAGGAGQTACAEITSGTFEVQLSPTVGVAEVGRVTVQGMGD